VVLCGVTGARHRASSKPIASAARRASHLNLGRKDLLAAHLDLTKLTRLLHGEAAPEGAIRREDVHAMAAWDWGPMLAARHLWCELGLEVTLDRLVDGQRRDHRRDAATVTTPTRSMALPDLPTVGEFVPGYEATLWWGVGAPRNTPLRHARCDVSISRKQPEREGTMKLISAVAPPIPFEAVLGVGA
jgi:hypothetical protein